VRGQGVPLLGICVGMQILAARGLEHGVTAGLGWITGEIAPMAPRGADGAPLPLPQMGWNTLDFAPLTARTDTAPLTARTDTAPLTAETVTAPLTAETDTAPLTAATHALLRGVAPGAHAYFVHSYALSGGDPAEIVATTDYGGAVPALVARGPIAGTQFHVEKSGETGLTILANFLRWTP
jgi:glutamine amidotransferase